MGVSISARISGESVKVASFPDGWPTSICDFRPSDAPTHLLTVARERASAREVGFAPVMLFFSIAGDHPLVNVDPGLDVLIALDLGQLIGLRLGHLEADVVTPDGGS